MTTKELKILKLENRLALLANRPKAENGNIMRKINRQLRNLTK